MDFMRFSFLEMTATEFFLFFGGMFLVGVLVFVVSPNKNGIDAGQGIMIFSFVSCAVVMVIAMFVASNYEVPESWFNGLPNKELSMMKSYIHTYNKPLTIMEFANIESAYKKKAKTNYQIRYITHEQLSQQLSHHEVHEK